MKWLRWLWKRLSDFGNADLLAGLFGGWRVVISAMGGFFSAGAALADGLPLWLAILVGLSALVLGLLALTLAVKVWVNLRQAKSAIVSPTPPAAATSEPPIPPASGESLPISIREVRIRFFSTYAGFFEDNNPDDAQLVDFGEVTIANISTDRRVALDLTLRITGKRTNMPLLADLRGPAGLLLGKDDAYSRLANAKGLERIEYFRNPVELGPQQVERKRLAFMFNLPGDGRKLFTDIIAKARDHKFALEVADHISGRTIAIDIPGNYRGDPRI